jgi:hypothetical protein
MYFCYYIITHVNLLMLITHINLLWLRLSIMKSDCQKVTVLRQPGWFGTSRRAALLTIRIAKDMLDTLALCCKVFQRWTMMAIIFIYYLVNQIKGNWQCIDVCDFDWLRLELLYGISTCGGGSLGEFTQPRRAGSIPRTSRVPQKHIQQ